jgi:hypothetical protein
METLRNKNRPRLSDLKKTFPLARIVTLTVFVGSLLFPIFSSYDVPSAGAQARAPLDLVSDFPPDVNGFDFNPKWAWQLTNDSFPDPNQLCFKNGKFEGCTTDEIEFDEPRLPNSATCAIGAGTSIKGHINWRPATYTGRIDWGDFAIDGDYCFELMPSNSNGLTAHRKTLHVEFDANETIKHFNTSWWKRFRKVVGRRIGGTSKEEKEIVKGRKAIVIGRLNLDCVHGCYTELHPVYALAINVETKVNANDGTVDEVWAIFARNWGNQGWCSHKQHYLNLETNSNKLTLLLPWGPDTPTGAAALSYEVLSDHSKFLSNNSQATGPELSIGGTEGIQVSFILPRAKDKARIHGELHLRWRFLKAIAEQPANMPTVSVSAAVTQEEGVEERLLAEALGEEGRNRAASESEAEEPDSVRQKVVIKVESEPRRRLFTILDRLTKTQRIIIQPAPPSQPPRIESEFDAEKAERDKRLLGTSPNRPQ